VLLEARAAAKPAMAKVALPCSAIPSPLVDLVRDVRVAGPVKELLGDESVGVLGAHEAVQLVAAQMGRLGAVDLGAAMDTRVEVLERRVSRAIPPCGPC